MGKRLPKIKISHGIALIIVAGFISVVLANSVDMSGYELGGMFNLAIPPFLTLSAILVFSIVCWLFKQNNIRMIFLIVLCLYILYTGIAFHLEKESWPLMLF